MRIGCRHRVLSALLTALALPTAACVSNRLDSGPTAITPAPSAATAVSTTPAVVAPPATQSARTAKWIDLQAGDCLADPPPTDPSVVNVSIVDCAKPHQAEVYSRQPVAVNAAIANVADQECAATFSQYTGRSLDGSQMTITYLIDSNQNRTSDNPTPSTVICLLQSANGQRLTKSARR
jgi:hypothetical protein